MDSATEASSSLETPMSSIVLAQSKAIDSILTRLVVLDPGYNPVRQLDWSKIQIGREMAARIERGNYDRVAETLRGPGGDGDMGDLCP